MLNTKLSGIDPKSNDAPKSVSEAVEKFFDVQNARWINCSSPKINEISEKFCNVVVTGEKNEKNPNYSIIDQAEGQAPSDFEKTFLALNLKNKVALSKVINLIKKSDVLNWSIGQNLLLTGKILTARDAAHKKLNELVKNNDPLPEGLELKNRFIYYVGPVDPVGDEVVGPAGPTTSERMDRYTDLMLSHFEIMGMIGKAERGDKTIESIKKHKATYLVAIGGSAFLVSQAIKSSRVVAFSEMGMEAIYEFEVVDMPVTVAVDSSGDSIHKVGAKKWKEILVKRDS